MRASIVRVVGAVLFAALCGTFSLSSRCEAANAGTALRVATFRCDVTPPLGGLPLIWLLPAQTIEDPLWAKGIVLDDGRQRYVICAVDWCGLCNSSHRLFRRKLAEAVSTPISLVTVHCVHQHTAPYIDGDAQPLLDREENPPRYVDAKFLDELTDRLARAARDSLAHLEPFDHIGCGEAKVDRVAANRRVPGKDGKMQVRYSLTKDPKVRAAAEGNIDPMLKTVTLARGQRPLVRLHYYATHPQSYYNDARVSADFVGFARDRLERKENVFEIYFTGCAGNITVGKYNDGTPATRELFAQRILAAMEAAVTATRWAPIGRIEWRTVPLRLAPRTDGKYAVEEQRRVMANPKASASDRARAAVCVSTAERAGTPFELTALALGQVRLLHLPGECLIEFQQFAQRAAPGCFVAVAAYGDLAPGYICPQRDFAEGGYEPTACRVAPDSERPLKDAIQVLLREE
jgi:hypothetical protein